MLVIDPKLLEQLEGSSCFSIAHDPKAKECKMCDLQQECAAKSAGNNMFDKIKVLKPETEQAMKEAAKKQKAREEEPNEDGLTARQIRKMRRKEERERIGMPNTKKMSVDELWALLEERGGTCETYDTERTQKMRLTIAIKETYIAEYEAKQKEEN